MSLVAGTTIGRDYPFRDMPELPEVESIRRGLLRHLVGRVIDDGLLLRRDILIAPGDPPGGFSRQRASGSNRIPRAAPVAVSPTDLLVLHTIVDVRRMGKQLAIVGEGERGARAIGVQLGMTGHLGMANAATGTLSKHAHAVWTVGKSRLVFEDPRRFGGLRVFRSLGELDDHWRKLGPDALTIDARVLFARLARSARAIKAALLDQLVLAGVGNIYADEALFRAGIHPASQAKHLSATDCEDLAARVREVLAEAVEAGGSSVRDYTDAEGRSGAFQWLHRVYGRSGLPCVVCGHRLSHGLLGQRTTVWCSRCQPLRKRSRRR